jgi:hypothetical protein
MSQQSVRQSARRSALEAQAVRRKERADRERRLEGLAVAVLTALGECDGAVRDGERRAGEALDDDGRRGLVSARGRRVVRQRRQGAEGDSAAPPGGRAVGRRRMSPPRASAAGLAAPPGGGRASGACANLAGYRVGGSHERPQDGPHGQVLGDVDISTLSDSPARLPRSRRVWCSVLIAGRWAACVSLSASLHPRRSRNREGAPQRG